MQFISVMNGSRKSRCLIVNFYLMIFYKTFLIWAEWFFKIYTSTVLIQHAVIELVYFNQVSEVAYGSIRRCLKSRPQTMYYITGKQLQQMIFHSCKKAELYNWWEYEEYFSMLELKLFSIRGHWSLTKLREWKRIAVLDFS